MGAAVDKADYFEPNITGKEKKGEDWMAASSQFEPLVGFVR